MINVHGFSYPKTVYFNKSTKKLENFSSLFAQKVHYMTFNTNWSIIKKGFVLNIKTFVSLPVCRVLLVLFMLWLFCICNTRAIFIIR